MQYTLKQVIELAEERLSNHAHCQFHVEAQADPNCPFCEDRRVWRICDNKLKGIHA